MNNWTASEIAFRCERLSIRMERLAQNFSRISALSVDGSDAETVLELVRESKVFLELIAIDLDVERAFELVQIQRQLSRWHIHWQQTWTNDASRQEISTLAQTWVARIQEMAGVLV
jgi:ferredoxin-fold anticodon binding domain-containing protein